MSDFPQQLPEYEGDGQEAVSFFNIWRGIEEQVVNGLDCFIPEAQVYEDENLVALNLTAQEFTEMLSSLYFGAEFAYPDRFMQIVVNFLKGIHCPPILKPLECVTYPTYAAFIQYPLQNPYSQPELIPDGYLIPPMVVVTESNASEYPDFELFDVVAPINSFPLDTGWFDDINEDMPAILINVTGEGKVGIKLLNTFNGGMAIVTVDNPPNLIDILAGIITGADNIIELNLDTLSIPPETAQERIFEVEVTGEGAHIIYVVFFPIIDDSLIPLRFGGGFRGVELCGFQEVLDMGVTDVKWDDNEFMLMQQKLGVYSPVTDFDLFLGYIYSIDSIAQAASSQVAITQSQVDTLQINTDAVELTVNENHEPRITALEERADGLDDDITALYSGQTTQDDAINANTTAIAALDTRLDSDEEDIEELYGLVGAQWKREFDFTASRSGWSNINDTWVSGDGFLIDGVDVDNRDISQDPSQQIFDSRVTFIELEILRASGTGYLNLKFQLPNGNFDDQNVRIPIVADGVQISWMQINKVDTFYSPNIHFDGSINGSFWLRKMTWWGRGIDPLL
jgi:hypothetical protein